MNAVCKWEVFLESKPLQAEPMETNLDTDGKIHASIMLNPG
jgi:hypothetical protein